MNPAFTGRSARRYGLVLVLLLIITAVGAIALDSTSSASRPRVLESLFQDDDHLLYASTPVVKRTLGTLARLGVSRLRLTILWRAIAPSPRTRAAPAGFVQSDPASYPAQAWLPYDRIVRLAVAHHIGVDFNLTAPGPLWAMAPRPPSARVANHYAPLSGAYGGFVTAVGRRYSGAYTPPGARRPLPRVDYWSIWNEPNQPGWLAPQWGTVAGQRVMLAPQLYRAYVDAGFEALRRTGHGPSTDTILVGELAPEGTEGTHTENPIPPLPFLRALYCVDAGYRPLTGAGASALGCPSGGDRARFVAAHPGLFEETGFAHHPYEFFLPPTASISDPNFAPLSDLSRLEHALDAILQSYGQGRRVPIYLTEYGYETDPPNPYRGVSPRQQSLFLNEAEYMAWSDPRVRALAQFLLYDDAPDRRYRVGSIRYWSTFQTGLLYANGKRKPSLNSYRLPIVVPQPLFTPGRAIFIWGMLRLAPHDAPQRALIQWRPPRGRYRSVATITTGDPAGFLSARVVVPGTGAVRILWISPRGVRSHSRAVGVQAR